MIIMTMKRKKIPSQSALKDGKVQSKNATYVKKYI